MKIVNQILVKLRLPKYWTKPNFNIVCVEKKLNPNSTFILKMITHVYPRIKLNLGWVGPKEVHDTRSE